MVESRKPVARELWLEAAFDLELLRLDEAKMLNKMRQAVAEKKFAIMSSQEKKNVAAVDVEIESLEEYRFMRDQEDKIYTIDELVRIAKKNSDTNF